MKKIILYIAASLDQRIAEPDGGMEWLTGFPNLEKNDYGYKDLLASIDTVIMSGRTYREILNMDVIWPYKQQKSYVVTRGWTENITAENIEFITENIIETISSLRNRQGKDIWLIGGGELISILLAADLIDEMQIAYIPVILGKGIPLFPEQPKESTWKLKEFKSHLSGAITILYQKKMESNRLYRS